MEKVVFTYDEVYQNIQNVYNELMEKFKATSVNDTEARLSILNSIDGVLKVKTEIMTNCKWHWLNIKEGD